ncbi:hypothetical protein MHTCC0001_03200 [Flavobacteriaceae bacterium MHTCC 0001]
MVLNAQMKSLDNPFFVFNNALNKNIKPQPWLDQATLLKNLGFDGMEGRETKGFLEAIKTFKAKGLKFYTNYVKIDIDQEQPYEKEWQQVLPKLEGSNLILWAHIHSKKYKPSNTEADNIIVPILQELLDLAEPYGVRIAIYPHVDFLAEKVEDSFRLASKANRENIGSVFNLCHFLKTDKAENLEKAINHTFTKLFAVSICGADSGDTQNMGWDRLIQPLGSGTFDVYRLVEMLKDKGYKGPIGLQCYDIKTPPELHLKQSRETWETYKQKYTNNNYQLKN